MATNPYGVSTTGYQAPTKKPAQKREIGDVAAPGTLGGATGGPVMSAPMTAAPATAIQPVLGALPGTAGGTAPGSGTGGGFVYSPGKIQPVIGSTPTPAPPGTAAVPPPPPGSGIQMAPTGSPPSPNVEDMLMQQWQQSQGRLDPTRQMVDQAAQGLSGGPDRTALAQNQYENFLQQGDTQFQQQIRDITQRNAAGGRLGSGMYGSDLVDAATAAERSRNQVGGQLSYDLANNTMSDKYNTLGALSGLEGQRFGQGQTGYGNLSGYGQRSFENQLATQEMNRNLSNDQYQQLLALLQMQGG